MQVEIKRLLKEIIVHRSKVIVIALTGIVNGVCSPLLIFTLKDIQGGFESGDPAKIQQVGLYAISLALMVAISKYFNIYTMNYTAEMVVNKIRLMFQQRLMSLNLSYHLKYEGGPGGLLSRSINDVRTIQDGLRMVADFCREPILAIGLFVNLLRINWQLTLTLLIVLPPILVFLRQISRSLRKYVLMGQEELEKTTSVLRETLDGIRTIQSYNLEDLMHNKLKKQTNNYVEIRRRVHARVEVMSPVTEFVATFLILAIFFYFSNEVAQNKNSMGDVLTFVASMMMLNVPLKKLQESYVRFQETAVAAKRVYEIIDAPHIVSEQNNAEAFPKSWNHIQFENVGFEFQNHRILRNVSFSVRKGEHVAFVGLSGSGKSSIVNMLPRFFDPTEGKISVDHRDLKSFSLKDLRKNIALVAQDVFLFNGTIENNIVVGDLDRDSRFIASAAQAANALDFVSVRPESFQSPVGDRGGLLSGGEKQRLSIARAIFKDAPILILDEATSALDSTSEKEVQRGIDSLLEGRTALIIAHRLSTIQKCDRIYVVKDGSIKAMGTHESLLETSVDYQELYSHQGLV
ncbi:MAG: ABC transporter ATP-binding protein [Pseudobdellovibrionaceae bacterium]